MSHYLRAFISLGRADVPLVGGKNASLGEMQQHLSAAGVKVPEGFASTAQAYRDLLSFNRLDKRIAELLADLDCSDLDQLASCAGQIRGWIEQSQLPPGLEDELRMAYAELDPTGAPEPLVAVRSSATAEDLPEASFAGQQDTLLGIRGADALIEAFKRILASLFTERAIVYRQERGFDHMAVALSVGVQRLVRSDLGSAGVMFTLDSESGFRDVVVINAAWGFGENVVKGAVTPDEYMLFKPKLSGGHWPIIRRQLGDKALRRVLGGDVTDPTIDQQVGTADQQRFALADDDLMMLARLAVVIEQHYDCPMDIEWARDGASGDFYIVQARPETVHAQVDTTVTQQRYLLEEQGEVLLRGIAVGARIGAGRARLIDSASEMQQLQDGEVLVTDITDPDWEPVLKRAAAIVTNRGGRVCHAAIVARELGIPAVVGCGNATGSLETGQPLTVSCASGREGLVLDGLLSHRVEQLPPPSDERPRTRIMLIVGNPEQAFEAAALPNDGVGLARLEFIINHGIGVHPRAVLEFDALPRDLQARIRERSAGYADPVSYYVERLTEGVGLIAAAFYPKPVIVRLSDFKSNEYASLLGGTDFEPREENPMIGFRGAGRYPSESFAECFKLECRAMRRVREDMGLDNVALMLPFVRTTDEAAAVLDLMASQGLVRGEQGLKVHFMCEIPANAVCADAFLDLCDGYSIGSNDLTQLTLGVDRDSELLHGYDERDPAVLEMMRMAIAACRRRGKYIGICGQAPSDFPEITRWLVEQGVESIALNPDSVMAMTQTVLATEKEAGVALREG